LDPDESIVEDPNIVTRPAVAAFVLVHGMMNGSFTGKKLGTYINATSTDYVRARRTVNGNDKAAKIERYAINYESKLMGHPTQNPIKP